MIRLTEQAHVFCRSHVKPGDIAIDATAGNGHDTVFLARQVGPDGTVFAVDIQPDALTETGHRLQSHGLTNVVLIEGNHAEMRGLIPEEHHGRIAAVMFNLGYRPGGDKARTTQPSETLAALEQSLPPLRPGGVLSVLAYTGHPGGDVEAAVVREFFERRNDLDCEIVESATDHRTSPPVLFAVRKRG